MPELWANLGLMQQQAGDIPGAISSFHQSNLLNPNLYVPNLFLGIDFERTGKAAQAIPFLTKAEHLNKTDAQTPLALGRAYFAAGKFAPAAREFTRATTLDPQLDAAWFALGISRLNQVETDAHRMSSENKTSAFTGALLAESLEKQGRFSEAASLYRTLLDSHPQPPCIHSELGFALLRHHDTNDASVEFASDRTAHPECSLAILGQARLALDKGDNEQAIKLLQELWGRDLGFFTTYSPVLLEGVASDHLVGLTAYLSQPDTTDFAEFRSSLLANLNGEPQPSDNNSAGSDSSPAATTTIATAAGPAAATNTAEQYYAAGEFRALRATACPSA